LKALGKEFEGSPIPTSTLTFSTTPCSPVPIRLQPSPYFSPVHEGIEEQGDEQEKQKDPRVTQHVLEFLTAALVPFTAFVPHCVVVCRKGALFWAIRQR